MATRLSAGDHLTGQRPVGEDTRMLNRQNKDAVSLQSHDPTTELSFHNVRIDLASKRTSWIQRPGGPIKARPSFTPQRCPLVEDHNV